MEALTSLKQIGSVEDYKTQFENLSNKLWDLSNIYKLSCFLSDIKDEIRLLVRMFNPLNLITAYSLAKIQEEHVTLSKRPTKWIPMYSPELGLLKQPNKPFDLPKSPTKNLLPIQKISQTQMKDRRDKGLCCYCEAKQEPVHKCQKPRLYLIEYLIEQIYDSTEVAYSSKFGQSLENGKNGRKSWWWI